MNKFFQTKSKGEIFELKRDLNSSYKETRKFTLKKVIQQMTTKDSSELFPDVAKLIHTEDLELKKLVYLYLINYAKTQPELVILVVNTFVVDSTHPNPMVRALAIRTMGCLRVEKIFNYLMDPLKAALQDKEPYVRKTACFAVLKLFDLNPTMCIDNGLLTSLQELLSDPNPMVISNAVAALSEIEELLPDVFVITDYILQKLLAALNDSTEWGQGYILNALAKYDCKNSTVSAEICERVFPRLQHVNSSVVLAAVKLLIVYLQRGSSPELSLTIIRKLAPPLVTLLSAEPEIQFVALRNISLILQAQPTILSDQVSVFFTKYNDPPYVKLEKLEIIVKLTNDTNADSVVQELKEYCNEVDAGFVRASIKALGKVAIKLPTKSDRCVGNLMDLLGMSVDHVVQETIVVMKDILRKYPQRYEGVIPTLCKNLESLSETESRASLVWIIGEYSSQISNAVQVLEHFFSNFEYEHTKVQMALLTSSMKLYLKNGGEVVHKVLKAGIESENPDIRDRAFMYYRLVNTGQDFSEKLVLAKLPNLQLDPVLSNALLSELLPHIGSIASVLHKPPNLVQNLDKLNIEYEHPERPNDYDRVDRSIFVETAQAMGVVENLLDLDLDFATPAAPSVTTAQGMDLLSMDMGAPTLNEETLDDYETFIDQEQAQGLEILGRFKL